MIRIAALLALWLAALPAAAQTVTLRSGDHAGFARLVFDIPPGTPWRLGRFGPDYALDLGPALAFDLAGAFDKITRDRIRALEPAADPGRLLLRIGCDCHARAFLYRPDKLVIDVSDGAPPAGSPWESPIDPALPRPAASLPLLGPTGGTATLLLDPAPRPAPAAAVTDLGTLAADLSRAVAAGLLEAPAAAGAASRPAAARPDALQPGVDPEENTLPGVSFTTADSFVRTMPGDRVLSRSGHACRPAVELDFAAWGPSRDFSSDVGRWRGRIVDAAGEIDAEAVTALARAYLHYGFGAEARRALAVGGTDSTTARFLGLIADLIDGRPVPAGALADQAGCVTPVALWAALADGSLAGRTTAERTAIEAALRVLPTGPRQAVAPRLAAMFLDAGAPETAAEILGRTPGQAVSTEEVVAVESDIALAAETAAAARETLVAAIRSGSRASAGTMVRLIDATIAAEAHVEPWMVETLAALRFEHRGGPMAGPLAEAEIRALTATDAFATARDRLADPTLPLDADSRDRLAEALARAIVARTTDTDFLVFAFAETPLRLTGAASNAVARRLLALGFPEPALRLLDPPADPEAMSDRRQLRAAALQALGRDEEAALVVAGMAAEAESTEDPLAAWRAGDWQAVRDGADPVLASAAAAVLAEDPAPRPDETLADRAALIAAAEETRQIADAILDRFPAPAEPRP